MEKLDLRKELGALYRPSSSRPSLVDVPRLSVLAVDGAGNPNTSAAFRDAIQALYPLVYTIKFTMKKAGTGDFSVMPLEALWWNRPDGTLDPADRAEWKWTAMIVVPDLVTRNEVEAARHAVAAKKAPTSLSQVSLRAFDEGRAAQLLHVGPYSAEEPTIRTMLAFIAKEGLRARGSHHEIYLSDPNRTAPEKLKTIVRQPVT